MFPHAASIASVVVSDVVRISYKFHIMPTVEMLGFI
jgi:hypothetical protein